VTERGVALPRIIEAVGSPLRSFVVLKTGRPDTRKQYDGGVESAHQERIMKGKRFSEEQIIRIYVVGTGSRRQPSTTERRSSPG
jgi:hypothetical protein